MRIDKNGVSRLVEDLVQKEFVERKPSAEDRQEQVVEALKIYNEACLVVEDNSND